MEVSIAPGRYVVAVSGGVDSIALLHMLAHRPGVQLTVAHYDHGIRADSMIDRRLVQLTAKQYGLPFVYHQGRLGPNASEAAARQARYVFLHKVRQASGAAAIVTAHHQDDALETAVLNLLRGTGRRGLSSLRSTDVVVRPLLHISKKDLLEYARLHELAWREDSTNSDERYLRNYIRRRLLPRLDDTARLRLIAILRTAHAQNAELEQSLQSYLHVQPGTHELDRHQFIMLPHTVAREVLAEWLRLRADTELNRKLLERLVIAAKTGRAGSTVDVDGHTVLRIGRSRLALRSRER